MGVVVSYPKGMANGGGLGRCQFIARNAQEKKQHIDLWYFCFSNRKSMCVKFV